MYLKTHQSMKKAEQSVHLPGVFYVNKEMSKTVGRSSLQTGKWEAKEFRGISRAQKP